MASTTARHRALREVLDEDIVSSQGDLVGLLADKGFTVTQATISRDLQAVGAVKVRDASGALRYTVGNGGGIPDDASGNLARQLARYALAIKASGNIIVVNTPPGAAHVVGVAIDDAELEGTIGTVAGDDTLIVIAAEGMSGQAVAAELERIGGSS